MVIYLQECSSNRRESQEGVCWALKRTSKTSSPKQNELLRPVVLTAGQRQGEQPNNIRFKYFLSTRLKLSREIAIQRIFP